MTNLTQPYVTNNGSTTWRTDNWYGSQRNTPAVASRSKVKKPSHQMIKVVGDGVNSATYTYFDNSPLGFASKKWTEKSGHLVSCFGFRSQRANGSPTHY